MNLNEFLAALKYGAEVSGDLTFSNAGGTITLTAGLPFVAAISSGTGSLDTTSTGTPIYGASNVTQGRRIYLTDFFAISSGSWIKGSVGTLYVQDSSGTNFAGIAVDGLKAGLPVGRFSGGSVNLMPAYYNSTGATVGAGLRLNADTSGNFGSAASAQITVVVSGIVK